MNLSFDRWERLEEPKVYLAQVNKELICCLNTTKLKASIKFNDISELSFSTPKFYNDLENTSYSLIDAPRQILVEGVGYFTLQHPKIISDGDTEYKECTALSTECELAQKTIKSLMVNLGVTGSLDDVVFCNKDDWSHSLLHILLEQVPNWKIGYVDPLLCKEMRFFEVDSQDIYSFLTTDVANTFGCIFVFDTFQNSIHAYYTEDVGEMTDVCVRMDTLGKEVEIDYDPNQLKTALYVYGADNIDVRDFNMGLDRLVNLDYFHTKEWMGKELYDAWSAYLAKWNRYQDTYTKLLSDYRDLLEQRGTVQTKNPDKAIDWSSKSSILSMKNLAGSPQKLEELAGLLDTAGSKRLEEWLKQYETILADQATLGYGAEQVSVSSGVLSTDEAYDYYHTAVNHNYVTYLITYNKILAIQFALNSRNEEIKDIEEQIEETLKKMAVIADAFSWQNNFTDKQLEKLSYFIREDTYQDDNFVITESMPDAEALEVRRALYEEGKRKLKELASPSLEFVMNLCNLLALPEFLPVAGKFDVGNYIYVDIREDYQVKVRILQINFNFKDPSDFNCVFGTAARYQNGVDLFTEDNKNVSSLLTSASIAMSYWQKGGDAATEVDKIIKEGLNTALIEIKNSGNNQSITWDETGIHMRRWNHDRNTYEPEECWMVNDKILFSADNFQSVKSLFGRVNIGGEDRYVVIAEAMFAGLIEASMLVGNEITNGNGFYVDKYGNLTSTSGHIGNWKIVKDGLYHDSWSTGLWAYYDTDSYTTDKKGNTVLDHHSLASVLPENGVNKTHYLAFWAGADGENAVHKAPFRVYSDGCMFATMGSLGNWTISDAGLYYGNYITGMWGKEEKDNNFQVKPPKNDPTQTSSGVAIWAGNYKGYSGIGKSPFMVTHDGHVYAKRGKIACFVVNEDYLTTEDDELGFGVKDNGTQSPTSIWVGWNNPILGGLDTATFKVGSQGDVTFGHAGGHHIIMKVEQRQEKIFNIMDAGIDATSILAYEHKNYNGEGPYCYWRLGENIRNLYPATPKWTNLGSKENIYNDFYTKKAFIYEELTVPNVVLSSDVDNQGHNPSTDIYLRQTLAGFESGKNIKDYVDSTFATKADIITAYNNGYNDGYDDGYDDGRGRS